MFASSIVDTPPTLSSRSIAVHSSNPDAKTPLPKLLYIVLDNSEFVQFIEISL